jgi:hypothetical protein
MTIYSNDGDFLPRLGLDRSIADALEAEQKFRPWSPHEPGNTK